MDQNKFNIQVIRALNEIAEELSKIERPYYWEDTASVKEIRLITEKLTDMVAGIYEE